MMFEAIYADCYPFAAGEVLIVPGPYEREELGSGRKSSKWDVESEWFDTAEEAVLHLRVRGLTPQLPDGYPSSIEIFDALRDLLQALT